MPLFEVETDAHIIITWASNEDAAARVVSEAYPQEKVIRLTKRPRDTWVISKGVLGITGQKTDPCTVARDCLVTVETHRYSVPAAYVGQTVEVQWGADATVQIYHQGTLIATHPRASGHHQHCVEAAHYAALQPSASPAGGSPAEEPVRLTSWTGPFPEVAVRALAVYEALGRQEVCDA